MNALPTVNPTVIWNWGVCQKYRDADHLQNVTSGHQQMNAFDVLALPIRDVDKLWVILRTEFLPLEVLNRFCDRLLAAVPNDSEAAADATALERARMIATRREAHDYWAVSRHTTAVLDRLKLSVPKDEHARQITILTEEMTRWLNEN
jgi:hypothetical protein